MNFQPQSINCPNCGEKLQNLNDAVSPGWETEVVCPKCKETILIRAIIKFERYVKYPKKKTGETGN
jgi:DNA-directed RNA polymerase subunit RPC12/RpoP